MKANTSPLATSQRQFILNAMKSGQRLDGRDLYNYRPIKVQFGVEDGTAEVKLGATRVLAITTCQLIRPITRPEEGRLVFNVELSPMASPLNHASDVIDRRISLERRLEQCFVESAAVDLESLCIVAGEKVWCIRVAIHVLDDVGNILDCASIAAIAALAHFRRPDVTVVGEDVTIHSRHEKEYVPLNIHHMPLCITFAFFHGNDCIAVDPTHQEEAVMDSKLIMGLNRHREICTIQFTGGVTLKVDQVMRCCNIALVKADQIIKLVQQTLKDRDGNQHHMDVEENHITNTENQETTIDISKSIISNNSERNDEQAQSPMQSAQDDQITISVEGNHTAEIGLGGPSTWEIVDHSIDSKDIIIVSEDENQPPKRQQMPKSHSQTKQKASQRDLSESEEDEVIILEGNDVMMLPTSMKTDSTANQSKPDNVKKPNKIGKSKKAHKI